MNVCVLITGKLVGPFFGFSASPTITKQMVVHGGREALSFGVIASARSPGAGVPVSARSGGRNTIQQTAWRSAQGTLIHNTKILHNTIQYVLIHNTAGQDPRMGVLFSLSLHCIFYIFYSDRAVAVTVTALRFTFI